MIEDLDENMMDELRSEFMERAANGDRKLFDFAFESSEAVNEAAQSLLMELVRTTRLDGGGRFRASADVVDAQLAFWVRCARKAFLGVLEKNVAQKWVDTEYEQRTMELRRERNNALQDEYRSSTSA